MLQTCPAIIKKLHLTVMSRQDVKIANVVSSQTETSVVIVLVINTPSTPTVWEIQLQISNSEWPIRIEKSNLWLTMSPGPVIIINYGCQYNLLNNLSLTHIDIGAVCAVKKMSFLVIKCYMRHPWKFENLIKRMLPTVGIEIHITPASPWCSDAMLVAAQYLHTSLRYRL